MVVEKVELQVADIHQHHGASQQKAIRQEIIKKQINQS
jgi:hypothetical protein